jgi:hypothetical protein
MLFLQARQSARSFISWKKVCYKERSLRFTASLSHALAIFFTRDVGRIYTRKFLKEHRQRILDLDRDWHGDLPSNLNTGGRSAAQRFKPITLDAIERVFFTGMKTLAAACWNELTFRVDTPPAGLTKSLLKPDRASHEGAEQTTGWKKEISICPSIGDC